MYEYSEEDLVDWIECQKSFRYFVEKYFPYDNLTNIQKDFIEKEESFSENTLLGSWSRNDGKTSILLFSIIHKLLFEKDVNIFLSSKGMHHLVHIMDKIGEQILSLPFHLRPERIYKENRKIKNDGGESSIEAIVFNHNLENKISGYRKVYLYIDEYNSIPNCRKILHEDNISKKIISKGGRVFGVSEM